MGEFGARLLLGLMWLLHFLPLPVLAALGRGIGRLLFRLAHRRRRIALRNIELCFPTMAAPEREALVRENFQWLVRSLLERSVLWHASRRRLQRLIQVEGEVDLADSAGRAGRPTMWLVPHFVGLEVAGVAVQLFQKTLGVDVYQPQRNHVFDAALKRGRLRFGGEAIARGEGIRPLMKLIKKGHAFFNAPDQDFGPRDAAFVPFFGIDACTLLAPSRMARAMGMQVQPIIVTMLPGGRGWRVCFEPALRDWPTDDALADTTALNALIEQRIRAQPAQYLWVHRRFKTRPAGEPDVYRV